ncbi:4-amino-4-deoxy-L-arabinose transferase [Nocardioides sp. TRM66260-LWL]|uniref:4-amino-4-deoxy-L-arabinose transferase n=1 Tax=Nocardioides sp. TRM66260-LWL TaxID=2874478 RepID=UPI001CC71F5E|nr:4-amino-4-deoxy-L-arabinose transferase [Nocardioides sp. TRM66260-LWL]MBZ5733877.1 4-amino-4-deoxy-L-arabinose transferase [Nocardioides sp. TRM66260-LWL]
MSPSPDPERGVPHAERVVEAALDRPARLGPGRLVLLDGPSGSGKTTLADAVVATARRRGLDARVVHLEAHYEGWDGLPGVGARLAAALDRLAAGGTARVPTWDWHAGDWAEVPAELRPPSPGELVVLEGVGAGDRALVAHATLLVWCEAERSVRRARALARDGEATRPLLERWWDAEDRHHAAEGTRGRADLVVST